MSVDGGMDAGGGTTKGSPPEPADPVELLRKWPELDNKQDASEPSIPRHHIRDDGPTPLPIKGRVA